MIWYFLAGFISGAVGLWMYAAYWTKRSEHRLKNYYRRVDYMKEKHPDFYNSLCIELIAKKYDPELYERMVKLQAKYMEEFENGRTPL